MNNGRFRILLLPLVLFFSLSMINNAYATEPVVTSFALQNVDNSDPVYSDGDQLKIIFSIPTDRGGFPLNVPVGQANVNDLFDIDDGLGNNYDGQWISNQIFVFTITDITGNGMTIGSSIAESNLIQIGDAAFPADTWDTESPPLELFIESTGGSCDKECQPPTLGLDKNNRRLVENGFSYNGNSVDSELFYTPYPLIQTTTGVFNTVQLKIYEDSGPDKISHVELNFGLAKGETINERRASIFWDKHFDGIEVVSVNSPTNAIDSVKIESTIESCRENSNDQCLVLTIHHRFREPLDFDILGTNVWDENRDAWQNYFNHGVDVQGDSLNSPNQHVGIYHGKLIPITQLDGNTGVDENGNTWIFDKTWKINRLLTGKIDDGISSHGFDRNSARFENYKQGQELLALHTLNSMINEPIQNDSLEQPKTHYPEFLKRSEDPELQNSIAKAKLHAYHTLYQMLS